MLQLFHKQSEDKRVRFKCEGALKHPGASSFVSTFIFFARVGLGVDLVEIQPRGFASSVGSASAQLERDDSGGISRQGKPI
jgi:hypothetical protein